MKKYFQKFSLNFINLFGIIILFFFAMLFTSLVIFEEYRDFEHESVVLRQSYLTTQKLKAKDETERVLHYIEYVYSTQQAQMGETQVQKSVVNSIEHLFDRKNGSSYIFIYTLDGTNVSDPNKPQNRGKHMIDLQDVNGKFMLKELIEEAQKGGGYVQYVWGNPSTDVLSQKISYALAFKPWNWLIGTGIYLNEIDERIAENRIKLKERLIKYMMEILTLSTILF
jgi:signal transduction histidine kinase